MERLTKKERGKEDTNCTISLWRKCYSRKSSANNELAVLRGVVTEPTSCSSSPRRESVLLRLALREVALTPWPTSSGSTGRCGSTVTCRPGSRPRRTEASLYRTTIQRCNVVSRKHLAEIRIFLTFPRRLKICYHICVPRDIGRQNKRDNSFHSWMSHKRLVCSVLQAETTGPLRPSCRKKQTRSNRRYDSAVCPDHLRVIVGFI